VSATDAARSSRRTFRVSSLLVAAAIVGVGVWLTARAFASASCPEHDMVRVASSCRVLVGSLAIRVGAAAGAAVLLMDLVSAGLRRTAESLDEYRRTASREDAPRVNTH
jgi:hypothetical protein